MIWVFVFISVLLLSSFMMFWFTNPTMRKKPTNEYEVDNRCCPKEWPFCENGLPECASRPDCCTEYERNEGKCPYYPIATCDYPIKPPTDCCIPGKPCSNLDLPNCAQTPNCTVKMTGVNYIGDNVFYGEPVKSTTPPQTKRPYN
jgi:hypothetical protein